MFVCLFDTTAYDGKKSIVSLDWVCLTPRPTMGEVRRFVGLVLCYAAPRQGEWPATVAGTLRYTRTVPSSPVVETALARRVGIVRLPLRQLRGMRSSQPRRPDDGSVAKALVAEDDGGHGGAEFGRGVGALIISPTRELARQTAAEARARAIDSSVRFSHLLASGINRLPKGRAIDLRETSRTKLDRSEGRRVAA